MEEDRKLAMQLLDLFLKNTEKTKGKTLSLIVDEVRGLSVVVSNNRGKELVTM